MMLDRERRAAIEAVILACRLCDEVQRSLVVGASASDGHTKEDKSPVTVADYGAQAVVVNHLQKSFPGDPMVGEEDAGDLRKPENSEILAKVLDCVRRVTPQLDRDQTLAAIDHGTFAGGSIGRHWTLDPIDGTKGFLRREQYAVALALIDNGEVILGVLGCPNLPVETGNPAAGRGCLFTAVRGKGAFMRTLTDPKETRISIAPVSETAAASFCESVESGHSSHGDSERVAKILGVTAKPVRMDSQAKYASVARGDAAIYLRLPTKKGYEEKIWDHAAGAIVIEEAGGKVTDCRGHKLNFGIGRTLRENIGVIVSNPAIHDRVIDAVRQVLGPALA